MTPELELLRKKSKKLAPLLRDLEVRLVDGAWPLELTLPRMQSRANPDVMSNVEAMAATNTLILWFGTLRGAYLGYWLGPKSTPLGKAPIVRLDTEGQYRLAGTTIANTLAISADEEDFDATRKTLVSAGFKVAASPDSIWKALKAFESPNAYRHLLYNEARKRRGLKPIK